MTKGVKYNIFLRFILDFSGNLLNKHLWSTYYAQLAQCYMLGGEDEKRKAPTLREFTDKIQRQINPRESTEEL